MKFRIAARKGETFLIQAFRILRADVSPSFPKFTPWEWSASDVIICHFYISLHPGV